MERQYSSCTNFLRFECEVLPIQKILDSIQPNATLSPDVEEALAQIAADFMDAVVKKSCVFAAHRNSSVLQLEDVALFLKLNCNMDPLLMSDKHYYISHNPVPVNANALRKTKKKRRRSRILLTGPMDSSEVSD